MASVRKRGDTFTITAYFGYDDKGKQIKKTTTFHPPDDVTAGKAEKLANAYAATWEDKIRGYVSLDENRTLSDLCKWYYDTVAPNTLKPNILITYRQGIENHIIPRIGREKLKNITPQMLDSIFHEMLVSGNLQHKFKLKDKAIFKGVNRKEFSKKAGLERTTFFHILAGTPCGRVYAEKVAAGLECSLEKIFDDVTKKKGLSGASVNKIKLNLSAIFTAAVKKEIMRRNPCKLVTPPKVDTKPAAFLDEEQSRVLLDALHAGDNFQLEVIVNLFLASGIRAGELTALHWEDIDLNTGLLQVRHTLARYKGQYVRQAPKTEQSERNIVLPLAIVSLLKEHKKRQEDYIQSLGDSSLYNGSVFTNKCGNYIMGGNVGAQLRRALKGLDLPKINLHSLRHTHASLLINSDIAAKIIADRLGHSTTKTTLDTYSHVFVASEVKAMQAVEMKLFQNAPAGITE